MDQRTRTLITLGCLVAAMSGTATLLGWMDPSRPSPSARISELETISLARTAVTEDVVVREDLWVDVQVLPAPSTSLDSRMLAASTAPSGWHFRVDADGVPYRGRDWKAQRIHKQAPGTVRISVATPDRDMPMSEAQWLGVRALITTLTNVIDPGGETLPVQLHQDWAGLYGLEPTTYFHVRPIDLSDS